MSIWMCTALQIINKFDLNIGKFANYIYLFCETDYFQPSVFYEADTSTDLPDTRDK